MPNPYNQSLWEKTIVKCRGPFLRAPISLERVRSGFIALGRRKILTDMEGKQVLDSYDPLSLSTHYLRMKYSETDVILATASGFTYEYQGIYYLITNGHNITRINPETNKRMTSHLGFPDCIETKCITKYSDTEYMGRSDVFKIPLYSDKDLQQPLWFVHPEFRYTVDVVAVPIIKKGDTPPHIVLKPLNTSIL